MTVLQGLRVVELARLLPGPLAGRFLADFGADVIKVEEPGRGDYARAAPPMAHEMGIYFANVNRNKRSLALDVRRPEGRRVLWALLERADVLLESYRPGWAARHGLDYPRLQAEFPHLIYTSVTGFGHHGPYREWPGHDLGVTGMSGLMWLNRTVPQVLPVQAADLAAAMNAVIGTLLAILARQQSGHGQLVDAAMFDALEGWMAVGMVETYRKLYAGENPADGPDLGALAAPFGQSPRYQVYETADGRYLSVALLEAPFWERFCRYLGRADLIDPEETLADRLTAHPRRQAEWRRELTAIFRSRPLERWMAELSRLGVPCCPVYRAGEKVGDPHFQARRLLTTVVDDRGRRFYTPGLPLQLSRTPGRIERAAPRLGQHSAEILDWLGIDRAHQRQLVESGTVTGEGWMAEIPGT